MRRMDSKLKELGDRESTFGYHFTKCFLENILISHKAVGPDGETQIKDTIGTKLAQGAGMVLGSSAVLPVALLPGQSVSAIAKGAKVGGIISKELYKYTNRKKLRKIQKNLSDAFPLARYKDFPEIVASCAILIFRSQECVFSNVVSHTEMESVNQAMSKLAEDAVHRILNYISSLNEQELKEKFNEPDSMKKSYISSIVSAVFRGPSVSSLLDDGHTLRYKYSKENYKIVKTTALYDRVGYKISKNEYLIRKDQKEANWGFRIFMKDYDTFYNQTNYQKYHQTNHSTNKELEDSFKSYRNKLSFKENEIQLQTDNILEQVNYHCPNLKIIIPIIASQAEMMNAGHEGEIFGIKQDALANGIKEYIQIYLSEMKGKVDRTILSNLNSSEEWTEKEKKILRKDISEWGTSFCIKYILRGTSLEEPTIQLGTDQSRGLNKFGEIRFRWQYRNIQEDVSKSSFIADCEKVKSAMRDFGADEETISKLIFSAECRKLQNKWWPDKKPLIKSLVRRKIQEKPVVQILDENLERDENRMSVVLESDDAKKYPNLGGVGKTLTVKCYAHDYSRKFQHIIWMDCGEGRVSQCFRDLAQVLKIGNRSENTEDLAKRIYEDLSGCACLWIFDNTEGYKGEDGIFDLLPVEKENFYCLITSRSRQWDTSNGQITELRLDIFSEEESVQFLTENVNTELQYTDYDLKRLCRLLGNLPQALQWAVAALQNGKSNLHDFIQKISVGGLDNDNENKINWTVSVLLDQIEKDKNGFLAKEILTYFGYLRPDDVQSTFLKQLCRTRQLGWADFKKAIELLERHSLITRTGIFRKDRKEKCLHNLCCRKNREIEFPLLSIHRYLQHVIRHNYKDTEKKTLSRIFKCTGFIEYKLIPFTQYADDELKNKFPKLKAQLVNSEQLKKLVKENDAEEAVHLAKYINEQLGTKTSQYNYAVCLEINGGLAEAIAILNKFFPAKKKGNFMLALDGMKKLIDYLGENANFERSGNNVLDFDTEPEDGEISYLMYCTYVRIGKCVEALEIAKQFSDINPVMKILSSANISTYHLICEDEFANMQIDFDNNTKRIEFQKCSVRSEIKLPHDLQELVLYEATLQYDETTEFDLDKWIPKNLSYLTINCFYLPKYRLSVESLLSCKILCLEEGCLLVLNSETLISPKEVTLDRISFVQNGKLLRGVFINEFVDFQNLNKIILRARDYASSISIDMSKDFVQLEYLSLENIQVGNWKESKWSVHKCNLFGIPFIERTKMEIQELYLDTAVDISTLPMNLEKLKTWVPEILHSGGIPCSDLKYLELKDMSTSCLSQFRFLNNLAYIYFDALQTEIDVDLLPYSVTTVRITKYYRDRNDNLISGGLRSIGKLIVEDFSAEEVQTAISHLLPEELVVHNDYDEFTVGSDTLKDFTKLEIKKIEIGSVDWNDEDLQTFVQSKYVDKLSNYYLFTEGVGEGIQEEDFLKLMYT